MKHVDREMLPPSKKFLAMNSQRAPQSSPWTREAVRVLSFLLFFTQVAIVSPISAEVPPDHAEKMKVGLGLFRDRVGTVLRENCLECHGGKQLKGEFDLSNREALLDSGYVDLEEPGESLLLKLIRHEEEPVMPKRKPKLAEADIAAIENWLEQGAPYDKPLVEGKAAVASRGVVTDADRDYWAFRRLSPVKPPQPQDEQGWVRNDVDRFILAKLEAEGIRPNPRAEPLTLLRRISLDVAGLPPENKMMQLDSDAEFDALTETLLQSPAFAQTWARRWLDLSRYAESAGFQDDAVLPMAWRYRDFVVQALQTNQRFDEFLRWQIAGDRLAPERPEASIATGFLALGPYQSPVTVSELEQSRYDELDDFLQTIGTGMLGLTIGCARCHDHKYDPLPTADYYALAACFTTTTRGLRDIQPRSQAELAAARDWIEKDPLLTAELKKAEAKAKASEKLLASVNDAKLAPAFSARLREVGEPELAKIYDQVRGGLSMEQVAVGKQRAMQAQFARWTSPDYEAVWQRMQAHLKSEPASPPLLLTLSEEFGGLNEQLNRHIQGPDYFRIGFQLNRGDPKQKQREATPGLLQVLIKPGSHADDWRAQTPPVPAYQPDVLVSSRTTHQEEFSRHLKLPGDPLQPDAKPAARDFGTDRATLALWLTDVEKGAGPLAARVIVNRLWHWHFGRGIVGTPSDFGLQGEPPTHPELLEWLAGELVRSGWDLRHIHRLILNSATWRQSAAWDAARSAKDPGNKLLWRWRPQRLTAEAVRDSLLSVSGRLDLRAGGEAESDPMHNRRALYTRVKRSEPNPLLAAFDAPEPIESVGQRSVSTVSPQALLMMNSAFMDRCAEDLSRRLRAENGTSDQATLIEHAYRTVLSRPPTATEQQAAQSFLQAHPDGLKRLSHVLLCLNELIYLN
jgi:mono/diheme cytochrome c family protein